MVGYRLSEQADARIDRIYEHSIVAFGVVQAERYVDGLWEALRNLAQFPDSGADCSELGVGLRRRRYGRHAIYYRIETGHVLVVDVLHQSMLPGRHLRPDD